MPPEMEEEEWVVPGLIELGCYLVCEDGQVEMILAIFSLSSFGFTLEWGVSFVIFLFGVVWNALVSACNSFGYV